MVLVGTANFDSQKHFYSKYPGLPMIHPLGDSHCLVQINYTEKPFSDENWNFCLLHAILSHNNEWPRSEC